MKKKKEPSYQLTKGQLASLQDEMYQKAKSELEAKQRERLRKAMDESARRTLLTCLAFPLLSMRDRGYGQKRLYELGESILEKFKAWDEGYISIEDVHNALKEEVGIDIQAKGDSVEIVKIENRNQAGGRG